MKKTLLTLLGALSVAGAVAGPVLAQPYGGPPPADRPYGDRDHMDRDHMDRDHMGGDDQRGGWGLDRRIDWMQQRIVRGQQDGSLTRREASRVQYQLNRIRQDMTMARRMHDGRLDDGARDNLQMRLDRLNGQIRWLRHNDDARPW